MALGLLVMPTLQIIFYFCLKYPRPKTTKNALMKKHNRKISYSARRTCLIISTNYRNNNFQQRRSQSRIFINLHAYLTYYCAEPVIWCFMFWWKHVRVNVFRTLFCFSLTVLVDLCWPLLGVVYFLFWFHGNLMPKVNIVWFFIYFVSFYLLIFWIQVCTVSKNFHQQFCMVAHFWPRCCFCYSDKIINSQGNVFSFKYKKQISSHVTNLWCYVTSCTILRHTLVFSSLKYESTCYPWHI